jgi:DNA-binding CsgD family transcriptional regulator
MNQQDLLAAMSLLYEGVLSPESWTQALEKLAALTSSQAASLVLWSRPTNQAMVGEQVGLPQELVTSYAEHYHLLDPARGHVDRIGTGEWYIDERELGTPSMRRSPFYREFLEPYDLDSTMASPFFRSPEGLEGFISLSGAFGRRDLAATASSLAPLMPHLQRAARLRLKLGELSQRGDLQQDVFDRLNVPIVVAAANRHVVMANRLGASWLTQPGTPMGLGAPQAGQVAAILRAACAIGPGRRAAGTKLRKPGGGEYYLTAVPLPSHQDGWSQRAPLALLLVSDPEQARPRSADLLRQVFHLTPAEVRLLAELQQGLSMKEACTHLQISPHTARTQLQSIFGKLGVRRQADIFRVLGQMDLVNHSAG